MKKQVKSNQSQKTKQVTQVSNQKSQHWIAKVIVVFAISAGIFFGINSMGSAATNATQTASEKIYYSSQSG